ncbi:MAG: Hsp70 family protein [Halomonadaceae bacterium]|jgi:molecular chaperone DnaK|uniref:Hsp70 family protein n=1 Tax=Halomonas sp. MCCC 1A11062 TaxID=2733485 RepID=UPI001F375CD4|nr:Hsp70 family protein [Halomonas sp. MCCC 1A11062]MCE8036109.1 Hsp70 family protein [Halomonas sp. MCCC 1A11062]
MYIGIDLGTSNSAVSCYFQGKVEVVSIEGGDNVLPSVIYVDESGNKLYGQRAFEQMVLSPDNVAAGFKRLMGTSTELHVGHGRTMTAEQASADIVRQLLAQAFKAYPDEPVEGCIVTIPAAFNQMQSEATLRATRAAGVEAVGLLQEPIAASMAAIAAGELDTGLFLVYDLGGGTFDVALVQSVGGAVNVLDNLGINMLGGRDFDREILHAVVVPWLQQRFSLPENFLTEPGYQRLLRIARMATERTKIALSSSDVETLFVSGDEIGTRDERGEPIYLDLEIGREALRQLIEPQVDETVALCRHILAKNGYRASDVARIVFIGGPTKTPWLVERVAGQLDIVADTTVDPMVAVSYGAAIFAESREWEEGGSVRKSSRNTLEVAELALRYDFPARTSRDTARLKVSRGAVGGEALEIQVDCSRGWTSGRQKLEESVTLRLPIAQQGENHFRISMFGSDGRPLAEASRQIVILRTHASATGIPATQTISAKVVEMGSGGAINTLEPMIAKGTLLPAEGTKSFRAARGVRSESNEHISLELYQHAENVDDPEQNLSVGAFRISGSDLLPGMSINKGDEVICQWRMNDSGILRVVIDVPAVGQTFDTGHLYADTDGHRNFDGEEGKGLLSSQMEEANSELAQANTRLGKEARQELGAIGAALQEQRRAAERAVDPEVRRGISERVRALRQDLSRLVHSPQHRKTMLSGYHDELVKLYERELDIGNLPLDSERFRRMSKSALEELERGDSAALNDAERIINEMDALVYDLMLQRPEVVVNVFRSVAERSATSVDAERHANLVKEGQEAVQNNEIMRLKSINNQLFNLQAQHGAGHSVNVTDLAGLMRG